MRTVTRFEAEIERGNMSLDPPRTAELPGGEPGNEMAARRLAVSFQ
jgi:hypothetical protein